jgi:ankyrin repeat protein
MLTYADVWQVARAVLEGDAEALVAAIDQGADINTRDALLNTPLHLAAAAGKLESVKHE